MTTNHTGLWLAADTRRCAANCLPDLCPVPTVGSRPTTGQRDFAPSRFPTALANNGNRSTLTVLHPIHASPPAILVIQHCRPLDAVWSEIDRHWSA